MRHQAGQRPGRRTLSAPRSGSGGAVGEADGRGRAGKTLRVGLVWAGRKTYQDDARRSLSLPLFAPLAGVPGVSFYALQVGAGVEQLAAPPPGMELTDLGSGVRRFFRQRRRYRQPRPAHFGRHRRGAPGRCAGHAGLGALAQGLRLALAGRARRFALVPERPPVSAGEPRRLGGRTGAGSAAAGAAGGCRRANCPGCPRSGRIGRIGRIGRSDGRPLPSCSRALAELNRLLQANQLQPAEELCRALLSRAPDHVELITLAGALARGRADTAQALALFQRAAGLNPALPELHNNLGVTLQDLGRLDEALSSYRQALVLRPDLLRSALQPGQHAVRLWDAARRPSTIIARRYADNPRYPDALYNLGNALRAGGDWPEAIECYRRLVELVPTHLSGWLNLGGSLIALNRFGEAAQAERQALLVDPQCREAHWNLGHALLAQGHYREGWREYEWRLKDDAMFPEDCVGKPLWDGSALTGVPCCCAPSRGSATPCSSSATCRYSSDRVPGWWSSAARNSSPSLPASRSRPSSSQSASRRLPFDCFAYLMSLPHLLGTTLDSIPAEVSSAPRRAHREWAARMPAGGVSGWGWSGPAARSTGTTPTATARCCPNSWRRFPVFPASNSSACCRVPWPACRRPRREPFPCTTWAATCATLPTPRRSSRTWTWCSRWIPPSPTWPAPWARRTFLLLPYSCDWRWLSGRDDSPWYPTLRLYRQERAGRLADSRRPGWPPTWPENRGRSGESPERDRGRSAARPEDPDALFGPANALRSEGNPGAAGMRLPQGPRTAAGQP